eukprot:976960-Prorocentrum_minimum.AAC.3
MSTTSPAHTSWRWPHQQQVEITTSWRTAPCAMGATNTEKPPLVDERRSTPPTLDGLTSLTLVDCMTGGGKPHGGGFVGC